MNNTVIKSIKILRLLSNSNMPLKLSEIVEALELPKTTVFNIINTLANEGLVKANSEKAYSLDAGIFEIAASYLTKMDLYSNAMPFLEQLCHHTQQTVYLVKKEKNEIIYIFKIESDSTIRTSIKIGTKVPLHVSSLGKAILSTFEENEIQNYLKNIEIKKNTSKTITDKKVFYNNILKDKQNGYSISDCEFEENIFCLGVPIYDHTKNAIAAISVSSLATEKNKQEIINNINLIKDVAKKLSRELGYIG